MQVTALCPPFCKTQDQRGNLPSRNLYIWSEGPRTNEESLAKSRILLFESNDLINDYFKTLSVSFIDRLGVTNILF